MKAVNIIVAVILIFVLLLTLTIFLKNTSMKGKTAFNETENTSTKTLSYLTCIKECTTKFGKDYDLCYKECMTLSKKTGNEND